MLFVCAAGASVRPSRKLRETQGQLSFLAEREGAVCVAIFGQISIDCEINLFRFDVDLHLSYPKLTCNFLSPPASPPELDLQCVCALTNSMLTLAILLFVDVLSMYWTLLCRHALYQQGSIKHKDGTRLTWS